MKDTELILLAAAAGLIYWYSRKQQIPLQQGGANIPLLEPETGTTGNTTQPAQVPTQDVLPPAVEPIDYQSTGPVRGNIGSTERPDSNYCLY